ncbi:MAG: hypothetical protein ACRDAM_01325, partial [Casimicrobium sp.]
MDSTTRAFKTSNQSVELQVQRLSEINTIQGIFWIATQWLIIAASVYVCWFGFQWVCGGEFHCLADPTRTLGLIAL